VKRLLRAPAVQSLLAWLLIGYAALVRATMRWEFVNREGLEAALGRPEGGMGLFWHGRIAYAMVLKDLLGERPKRVMISLSRDGEFIAKAAERLGAPAIRGSTGRAGRSMVKGGAAAFRQALSFVGQGGAVLITPDGPRGPNQVLPIGPVALARAAGSQVFLTGAASRPALAFKSWDEARLPLPFSRGCLVIEGPFHVPADVDDKALEGIRADWQARMRDADRRAAEVVGRRS
jgi:lysophospholipid acyltransferase (LPLAT)-like uncharacterized protein